MVVGIVITGVVLFDVAAALAFEVCIKIPAMLFVDLSDKHQILLSGAASTIS